MRRAARAKPPFLKIGEICLLDFRPRPLGAGSHGAVDRAFPLLATRARRNVRADSAHAEPARRRPLPRLVKSAARTRLPALPTGVVGRRRPRGTVPRLHAHRKGIISAGEINELRPAFLFFFFPFSFFVFLFLFSCVSFLLFFFSFFSSFLSFFFFFGSWFPFFSFGSWFPFFLFFFLFSFYVWWSYPGAPRGSRGPSARGSSLFFSVYAYAEPMERLLTYATSTARTIAP